MPGLDALRELGLGARPRACYNCRRRRLRCDRSIPSCRKCSAAGEQCLGYGTVLRWANGPAIRGKLAAQLTADAPRVKTKEPVESSWDGSVDTAFHIPASLLDPLLSHLGQRARHYVHHCECPGPSGT